MVLYLNLFFRSWRRVHCRPGRGEHHQVRQQGDKDRRLGLRLQLQHQLRLFPKNLIILNYSYMCEVNSRLGTVLKCEK